MRTTPWAHLVPIAVNTLEAGAQRRRLRRANQWLRYQSQITSGPLIRGGNGGRVDDRHHLRADPFVYLLYQFCRQFGQRDRRAGLLSLFQLEPTRAAEKGTDAGERGDEEMEGGMLPCMLTYTRSRSPLHPFTRVGNSALCALLRALGFSLPQP